MTAFNVVRFRVKPGAEQAFLDAHRNARPDWPGGRRFTVVKAGEGADVRDRRMGQHGGAGRRAPRRRSPMWTVSGTRWKTLAAGLA